MATVLLAAAGSAIGGSIGSSLLGVGAAALGRAAGAVVGSIIDQKVLGGGAKALETGRAQSLHLQTSTEGAAIPQVFGRMRVAGQVVWSTRFDEHVRTTRQGGKGGTGGQEVREYSYTISLAIALCEGPIDRIGRIWADGKPYTPPSGVMRIYTGGEQQSADPKIEAVEGAGKAPPYRGIAYVVFEDLPVGAFGNRIPQFNFEVIRSPQGDLPVDAEERGKPLPELIQGVALSPGSGEFALETEPFQNVYPAGGIRYANVNNAEGRPDMLVALDQLQADLPQCRKVSLIVSWFGSDLRAAYCNVEPRAEARDRVNSPRPWSVAGLTTADAPLVSQNDGGRPNFGGTPSDESVVKAIRELQGRGLEVMVYPFLLMDIPAGNALPDPYGGAEQARFPWRGRITLEAAPGIAGSTDKTTAATSEVAAFFGTAKASDFSIVGESVVYSGPAEWSWRRCVLHMAALAKAAGGVESFCIGSEFRGLTTIRDGLSSYPAVDELVALTDEVRQLLPGAKLTYAADWSEYFGHQPADGSGDVMFHMDPLWAHSAIDFVGIDDYTPLSDWRHSSAHLDRVSGAPSVYSLPYLQSNVEGGEYYDWYYASGLDRDAQQRSVISDGAFGEDWVFRPKDIRGWWSNAHHHRIGGVRQAAPTAWVPGMKPVRLTETGCPALDLGANQPNVFFDGRSSESALPYHSLGARDDEMQRRFLQAKLGYWALQANNPVSSGYGGPMIDGVYVWTWDSRPWPDFPLRESVWADGPSHRLGHWITGRVAASSLAEVVAEICQRSGLTNIDVSGLYGAVEGYLIDRTQTAREALQPLMLAYGFDAVESAGRIVFRMRGGGDVRQLDEALLVAEDETGPVERVRESGGAEAGAVRLTYVESEADYRRAAAESALPNNETTQVAETSLPLALASSKASGLAERWLAETARARDRARFALPPSMLFLEPGDTVAFPRDGRLETYRLESVVEAGAREAEAVRVELALYRPTVQADRALETDMNPPMGPLDVVLLDLPLANGSEIDHQPWLAVTAEPWAGPVAVWRSASGSYDLIRTVRQPALMGTLLDPLPAEEPGRWHRIGVRISIVAGALNSRERLEVLNGENRLAMELPGGDWEMMQFQGAVLTAPDEITVSTLLRGQRGTDVLVADPLPAGARIVVLDSAVVPVPLRAEEVGLARNYRIGPARFDHAHPSYVQLTHAAGGVGLRPFAPAHLRANQALEGTDVSWTRTTRVGGDSWIGIDVPLGEERERYRVRIFAGGTVLRSAQVDEPKFLYDEAMKAADGASGEIEIRVAQISALYGYGSERVITSNV